MTLSPRHQVTPQTPSRLSTMAETNDKVAAIAAEDTTENRGTHNPQNNGDGGNNDTSMSQEYLDATESGDDEAKEEPAADKKRALEGDDVSPGDENEPLPTLPLKKARTAYFIFADEKREELKQLVSTLTLGCYLCHLCVIIPLFCSSVLFELYK